MGGGPGKITPGPRVRGIDVSQFQGTIDWARVAASGIGFAFARASDGFYHDPTFQRNWDGMKAHGIVRGAYQFFRGSRDGAQQANDLLARVTLAPGDLPLVADVEVLDGVSPTRLANELSAWVDVVTRRTGRAPIIYTSPGLWNGWKMPSFAAQSLWVAHWGVSSPSVPSGWTGWSFWQYSDHGSVPGINAAVDLDEFHGTVADLAAYAGHGAGAAPAPAPPAGAAKTYTVQAGDTLSSIAARVGVSLAALIAANPQIANPNVIVVGQVINLP